jgi:hypothetical protein
VSTKAVGLHSGLSNLKLIRRCADLEIDTPQDTTSAAAYTLQLLARRILTLTNEVYELDQQITTTVTSHTPPVLTPCGVGPDNAAAVLIAAGDNPTSCAAKPPSPPCAASAPEKHPGGNTTRRRLTRGGDRQANSALYRIALCRLRWDPRTRDYLARRITEGKTRREAIRSPPALPRPRNLLDHHIPARNAAVSYLTSIGASDPRPNDQAAICADCAGFSTSFRCSRCSEEGKLHGGRLCTRCTLSDRLRELLSDDSGVIRPELTPLVNSLLAAERPLSILTWLYTRKDKTESLETLMRQLGQGQIALTHEAFTLCNPGGPPHTCASSSWPAASCHAPTSRSARSNAGSSPTSTPSPTPTTASSSSASLPGKSCPDSGPRREHTNHPLRPAIRR